MNESCRQAFFSEEEIVLHRMETFHRQRVALIAAGQSPLGNRREAYLVVHLFPHCSFRNRKRFDGPTLAQHGANVPAFGDRGNSAVSRFNVDGLLKMDSNRDPDSYVQIFRDGRLEAVMSDITFRLVSRSAQHDQQPAEQPRYFRDTECEQAIFRLVPKYLTFCEDIGISRPVSLFSALIGCDGAQFHSDWPARFAEYVIDRSPAFLPDIELTPAKDEKAEQWLRSWCDLLAQSLGFEASRNYDRNGNRQERKR